MLYLKEALSGFSWSNPKQGKPHMLKYVTSQYFQFPPIIYPQYLLKSNPITKNQIKALMQCTGNPASLSKICESL